MSNKPPANRPETYLTGDERAMVNRLLGFPEEFPQKFIAWLDDHLKVNIPQFPVTQIHGFQTFAQSFQQFINGEGANWELIDAKGDLLVGFSDDHIAVLEVGSNGQVLIADSTQPGGMRWGAQSASATGQRELAVVFTRPAAAVSANTSMSIGISALLAATGGFSAARAFITNSASNDTVITIGSGVSDDPITIQTGDLWDDGTASFADPSVATEDIIPITVTGGTGGKGLTVILTFG